MLISLRNCRNCRLRFFLSLYLSSNLACVITLPAANSLVLKNVKHISLLRIVHPGQESVVSLGIRVQPRLLLCSKLLLTHLLDLFSCNKHWLLATLCISVQLLLVALLGGLYRLDQLHVDLVFALLGLGFLLLKLDRNSKIIV